MKITRHRGLLIALLVIIVGVPAGLAWLVWPQPQPKTLKLRLKYLKTEVVDGKTRLLFRVEGAEKYGVQVMGFRYVPGRDTFYFIYSDLQIGREFYADHPQYSLSNYEGCRLEVDVTITAQKSKFSQLRSVITDTWESRKQLGLTFSSAKLFWRLHPPKLITQQVLTSDPLTNIPPH